MKMLEFSFFSHSSVIADPLLIMQREFRALEIQEHTRTVYGSTVGPHVWEGEDDPVLFSSYFNGDSDDDEPFKEPPFFCTSWDCVQRRFPLWHTRKYHNFCPDVKKNLFSEVFRRRNHPKPGRKKASSHGLLDYLSLEDNPCWDDEDRVRMDFHKAPPGYIYFWGICGSSAYLKLTWTSQVDFEQFLSSALDCDNVAVGSFSPTALPWRDYDLAYFCFVWKRSYVTFRYATDSDPRTSELVLWAERQDLSMVDRPGEGTEVTDRVVLL